MSTKAAKKRQHSRPHPSPAGNFRPPIDTGTAGPRYLALARKDVRLREDQMQALSDAARRLSRQRTNKAERITENTLIRVAVDLLLSRLDDMTGDTEEALLWSLQQ
jgi:hypothetical protein